MTRRERRARQMRRKRQERVFGVSDRKVTRSLDRLFGVGCLLMTLAGCAAAPVIEPVFSPRFNSDMEGTV